MRPSEILTRAAEIVSERWQQGAYGYCGGPRCAVGAMFELFDADNASHLCPAARSCLGRAEQYANNAAGDFIAAFNDTKGRTAAEVAAKLREAAEMARGNGE